MPEGDSERTERMAASIERDLKQWATDREAKAVAERAHFERLDKALGNEDLTGVLVRGHLFVENEMAKTLANAVPHYDKISDAQLPFEAKIMWLRALALISGDERKALATLNQVRNSLVHVKKPGVVPEITREQIDEISASLPDDWRESRDKTTDARTTLRSTIVAMCAILYLRAQDTSDEFGRADMIRYHLTGQTVQQRIEMAREQSEHDNEALRNAKDIVSQLQPHERADLRTWMTEVYHHD